MNGLTTAPMAAGFAFVATDFGDAAATVSFFLKKSKSMVMRAGLDEMVTVKFVESS